MYNVLRIFVILLFTLTLFSCSEEEIINPVEGCQSNNGTIMITNNHGQSIKIIMDGVNYGYIASGDTKSFSVSAGNTHTLSMRYSDGSTACTTSHPSVGACETLYLTCG
jgi:hypothetical protein